MSSAAQTSIGRSDRSALGRLLSERNQYPDRADAIDAQINAAFGRKLSMLVLDLCGFSRLTARYGVIHFLSTIHQMEQGATPAVVGNGGQVIKQEADNLFAIFAQPSQALEAALDMLRSFEAMNAVVPEHRAICASIGIGFGDTLVIDEADLYGHEMNLACKLGEDLAQKGEILLTASAHAALSLGRYACTTQAFALGGLALQSFRFERCLYPRVPMRYLPTVG